MTLALIETVEHPAVARARLHRSLSLLVERLIGVLDDLAGDPDLEDGGDHEPSLSFTGNMNQDQAIRLEPMGGVAFLDLEEACEGEGAEHDGCEPETGDGAVEYASDHDHTSVPGAQGWKP